MTAPPSERICLVTGGGGFIGSHLVERLLARGDRVVVIDNFSTGRRGNLAGVQAGRVRVIEGDVANGLDRVEVGAFNEIYHLAAAVGVRLVIEQPVQTIETNVIETSRLLRFAIASATPVLLASTSEVYGKSTRTPFSEDDDVVYGPTTLHRWSYACSKAIDEYLALASHRENGLPITIARLFNTVGPRQVGDYGMVLPRFVASAIAGRPLEVYGDGRQSRCFCDVRDVAVELPRMLAAPPCIGRVFNLGRDEPITIGALAELVVATLESGSTIAHVPYEEAFGAGFDDLRERRPDLARIRAATGFEPRIPLEQTIRDLAAGMRGSSAIGGVDPVMSVLTPRFDLMPRDTAPPDLQPVDAGAAESVALSALDLLNSYTHVFVAAFLITLLATPIIRRMAVAAGVVDRPDAARKLHRYPVAYLGGVAVFLGLMAAIGISYFTVEDRTSAYLPVPIAIIIGMVAITFTGFADDVWGWDPRLKIAGQLVAAAALAVNDIGVRVAEGLLRPFLGEADVVLFTILDFHVLNDHLFYWSGTAILAIFVVGGCNSANLIDGLDGLLSGVVGVVAIGLLVICLLVAPLDSRPFERSQAEANVAVEALQAQAASFREREGRYPRSLDALRGSDAAEPPALPVGWSASYNPVTGAVTARDNRARTATATARSLRGQVRLYREREGRHPITLDALVDAGYLERVPNPPKGFFLEYNPNSGQVTVVGGEASMNGARIVLCLALLGAVLGFLPHNFNPATIFLGDCGSLLLGYMCVVIVLMLGHRGETYFVFAGLIVYSVPIIDTTLAIIRRRLAGTSLSAADDQHLHHQLKRALGGVRRAVIAIYGMGVLFAVTGISLVALVLQGVRVRVIYAIALVLFSSIAVLAVKAARRQQYGMVAGVAEPAAPRVTKPAPAGTTAAEAVERSSARPEQSRRIG